MSVNHNDNKTDSERESVSESEDRITSKRILIFGGSGSLGNCLVSRYYKNNKITVFSRDECKHWKMSLTYNDEYSSNISYVIGDIRDYNRVETTILRERPHIIIVASAMKHIDRSEYAVEECVQTNYNGILNVVNCIERCNSTLTDLSCVVYVSTDKACSPVNTYGISKALGERVMVERSYYGTKPKFVCVRYGNVLNSNGSIIQILHSKGQNPEIKEFTLTHPEMTRFIQTLEQSVDLIEHSILSKNAESGDIVIPRITSMKVKDMIDLFSEKYNKPVKITGLRPGEKMLESLINESQSTMMIEGEQYYYIKPPYKGLFKPEQSRDYNSHMNTMSKESLKDYLMQLNLL